MESSVDPETMTVRARVAWPSVLADLHLARRYRAAQGGPAAGAPREPASPIGRLAGRAGGATRDASASQVATMWHLVQREEAWRTRQGFVEHLERWLEETTPSGDSAVDWARARRAAERITQLAASDARLLALLSAELIENASWHSAAVLTAEVSAPTEVRAAWIAREASERGTVGRPRREVTEAPVAVERVAWGEARLTGAVLLDLLNDRAEVEFRGVSEELARLDGECPRPAGYAVEAVGSRIADSVRRAYAGGV